MTILMLTHRLPYAPNRGDRRRAYHLLRYLSARHDVHLVSLVHDTDEASRAPDLAPFAASVSTALRHRPRSLLRAGLALAGATPLTHVLLDAPTLARTVAAVTARVRPDLVFAYGSALARFALASPLTGTPFLLDLVDVDSAKWADFAARTPPPLRWVYGREARRLGAFEAAASRSALAALVVNEREHAALRALAPDAHGLVVPNGIDLAELAAPGPPSGRERVLFCGVMDYRPNDEGARWFLTQVWPLVRAARPSATLCLAGTAPTRALRRMATGARDVEITGHVEDVRPYYWDSAVFVAPLHLARGVQNKVLDAAAAGLPSVITTAVADGLPREVLPACQVADDARAFAARVIDGLAKSPATRRAEAGRADLRAMNWSERLAPVGALLDALEGTAAVRARPAGS